ncbi:MAG: TRAP transporter TatT component family protein [Gammaproteobacteria bacterium]|nr:TRAP transporter TatT component family protein [Gammaproteobacteria bacterium]
MRANFLTGPVAALGLLATALSTGGCATLVSNAATNFGNNLTGAILNQDDPELVRAGMPSYILLLDSFLADNPDNPALLSAAASMYASYGAVFADEPGRAARLTARARDYALRAMCGSYAAACGWRDLPYEDFVASLAGVSSKEADVLFTYGFATLAYLRAHSSDWNSLAELPQAEALLNHYLRISGDAADATAYTYLGIILTLRPPALGGKPEEARRQFERAIALSDGQDLSAKVEYAKGYAKMLYERDLHDRLLQEVLAASPRADGYTLTNVLAQKEAVAMLAAADDYF